ncbi:proline dehydrogenase family protein [Actinomadura citrea]|uniref:proline dehydrogenase n=1 Tax=Actinomadura citrea TaxID=46158 RepID=A0A7Y9GJ57_9ACTN|nr:proline dehydrogenase family protein [Actinomadura citrea]NYE17492.1 proline dehydrogenase [Actinomadura citrea]GGU01250.1 proline dehydrogenase [Actinomadura citrea]
MLRQALLVASRSGGARRVVETAPFTGDVVRRFVAGETIDDALRVTGGLTGEGLLVSLDVLGEDTHDEGRAEANAAHYVELLGRLGAAGLGRRAEVSLKLSAIGRTFDEDLALENARRVCAAARSAGTTVTIDMEEHTAVDSTLGVVHELRRDYPDVGAVVQAYLRRAEEHCAELAYEGSRVRLCKGAYAAPAAVAFTDKEEVDRSYVRCMKVLMAGKGYPMLATHDPRLIEVAGALSVLNERDDDTFEYQMLYGIRPQEQRRLAAEGAQVRVYVPYGREWYQYFMRRLAERPANLRFFMRSLVGRS